MKALLYSLVNLVVAACVYSHLITGGWLANYYQFNDPNIINLVLAIFEPIAVLGVIAYWTGRGRYPSLYRVLFTLFLFQLLIAAGFLIFIVAFLLFWHPRLM